MSDRKDRDPAIGGEIRARPIEPRGDEDAARERDRSAFEFDHRDQSIGGLFRQLANQGSHLAEQQTRLLQAEVRSSVNDLKQAAGAMAGAAILGIAGLGVLLMGISFLLAEAMDLWLATLIVAVATLGGAYAMYAAGQTKLQSTSMTAERSRRTLERAPDAMSGDHTNEGR